MFGQQENTLWVESFRPDTLEGYIGNEHIIEKVKIFIENGDVPHLLFYGSAGTGKTTLAKIKVVVTRTNAWEQATLTEMYRASQTEDAKRMGVASRGTWQKYPRQMRTARAVTEGVNALRHLHVVQ